MGNKKNLSGLKFGRLTVIRENGRTAQNNVIWLCKCDCGKEVSVASSDLITKHTSSCGCLKKESSINRFTTHGQTKTPLYRVWASMIQRCYYPKSKSFKSYGEKGVTVCDEWRDFDGFYNWAINNGYKETLSIDRVDCKGNYSPDNCQWIPLSLNREKHRDSIMLNHQGEERPLKTWCDKLNLPTQTVRRFFRKNGKELTEQGIAVVISTGDKQFFNTRKKK